MRRQKALQIGELINQFMREEGLETPYNEYRIEKAWGEVMGQGIMRYTGRVFVKNQTLYVELRSSVIRQELMLGRPQIVARLNNHVGAQVIQKIMFI
ncbi:MAG: DUF721 domain-containing protein [Bacteroidaceae bacterium]|nr:DUF721 domain-containing protein [Bacteroidaceae bacterium]